MIVLYCYCEDQVKQASQLAIVNAAGLVNDADLHMIDVSESRYGYYAAIRKYWRGVHDLVVVEHDNVVTAEVLPSFKDCDEHWCVYKYTTYKGREIGKALGCTKFSAEFQRSVRLPDDELPWWVIDHVIAELGDRHRFNVHCHGTVEHLHEYNPLTQVSKRVATERLAMQIFMLHAMYDDPSTPLKEVFKRWTE